MPEKKGLSPIAWVAIGCGGLILIVALAVVALLGFGFFKAREVVEEFQANPARAAAEAIVKFNPDLEHISTDDQAGTITFRDTRTGKDATLSFQDLAEGKLRITTDEGEFQMDAFRADSQKLLAFRGPDGEATFGGGAGAENVPDWVPLYHSASEVQSALTMDTAEGRQGYVTYETYLSAEMLVMLYREWLEEEGYEVQSQPAMSTPQGSYAGVAGEHADSGRMFNMDVTTHEGASQVRINHVEKTM